MARTVVATALVLLVFPIPTTAEVTGYTADFQTRVISTFTCPIGGPWACYVDRTELGTIDGIAGFFETTMSPSGELVIWDRDARELVWVDVPSLDVHSRLAVDPSVPRLFGLAFDRNGDLWTTHEGDLYTIDVNTGAAALRLQTAATHIEVIAFVGDRLFAGRIYEELYEIDITTGDVRLVTDFAGTMWEGILQLAPHDGRLWALLADSGGPMPGPWSAWICTLDLESGDVSNELLFGHAELTLALVNPPDQPTPAVPELRVSGLIALVGLIGLAGVIVSRRTL